MSQGTASVNTNMAKHVFISRVINCSCVVSTPSYYHINYVMYIMQNEIWMETYPPAKCLLPVNVTHVIDAKELSTIYIRRNNTATELKYHPALVVTSKCRVASLGAKFLKDKILQKLEILITL